ncbi:hypothetical protein Q3G72_023884 [Acer saccharum]|nr:hypothetical protein Q3G72_023884 [Acer saccharum]
MSSYGFEPDNHTYPCLLKACSGLNSLWVGLQIHGAVVKVGLDSNLFIGNGLVCMYGKCGCLVKARRVLDEIPSRDVVSWNSMVAGYAQSGKFDDALEVYREMESFRLKPDAGTIASLLPAVTNTSSENVFSMPAEAVDLYSQMDVQGIEPDAISVASVLPACGDLSALLLGRQIHKYVERKKLRPNLLLENALIDMYAKCGSLAEARAVFDGMQFRDVVSWTSMISAYGRSGKGCDVALFSKMQNSGLCPDSIAFVSVLSACSHSRAGKVEEAYSTIRQMPMEPNERVWGASLGACRVYSNMDIGLLAADHLFRLAPEQSVTAPSQALYLNIADGNYGLRILEQFVGHKVSCNSNLSV